MSQPYSSIILFLFILIYLVFIGNKWKDNNFIQNSISISCSMVAALLTIGVFYFLDNLTRLKLFVQTKFIYRNEKIRFSISYLFRIRVNDKYLLVRNSRFNFFQPVGGVYKQLPGSERIFQTLGVEPDNTLKTSGKAEKDLRLLVPIKNAIKFIDWFESEKDREISHWREFYEELIEKGILDNSVFPNVDYRFLTRIITPIHKAPKIPNRQILIYDILEIIPSEKQKLALQELELEGDKVDFKWAPDPLIDSLGYDIINREQSYDIARHAKIMKELKWIRPDCGN